MRKKQGFFYYALPALTAIGVAAWQACTFPVLDDLVYQHSVIPADYWYCGGELISTPGQLWEAIWTHYAYVNSRLANLIALVLMQLPRQLCGCLTGLMTAFMLMGLVRLSGRRTEGGMAAATLLMWTAFPWYNGMASIDYVVNYVWASAMALWAVAAITSRGRLWWWAALGVAAGWMHEGVAAAAIGYTAGYMIMRRGADRRSLIIMVALLAGFALNLCGATTTRALRAFAGEEAASLRTPMAQWLRSMLSQFWPLWLGMCLAAIAIIRKRTKLRALLPAIGMTAASFVLALAVGGLNRTAWGVQLGSIILILQSMPAIGSRTRRFFIPAVSVATVVYILWLTSLVGWQIKFSSEERALAAEAAEGADTLRTAMTPANEVPFYLMGMISHPAISISDENYVFARHYMKRQGAVIVPPGSPRFGAMTLVGDCMIVAPADWPETLRLTISYGKPAPAATPINMALAAAMGKYNGFDTEVEAVRSRIPGIYFFERPGRLSHGREIIDIRAENVKDI